MVGSAVGMNSMMSSARIARFVRIRILVALVERNRNTYFHSKKSWPNYVAVVRKWTALEIKIIVPATAPLRSAFSQYGGSKDEKVRKFERPVRVE